MPVKVLLKIMNSADIAECLAFDALKDKDYRSGLESENMNQDELKSSILRLFGVKSG